MVAVVVVVVVVVVNTQRNSTQLKATLKQLALELDIVVTCTHICCGTSPYMLWNLHTNSNSTIKNDPRALKFCMRPHLTKLTTSQHNFHPTAFWEGGSYILPIGLMLVLLGEVAYKISDH